jgi:hypothetical protein
MSYANGNGAARPVVVVRGRSLALRTKLTKTERALLAADVYDGTKRYQPTRRELAVLFGVSGNMIDRARRLTAEQRQLITNGWVSSLAYFDPWPRPLALPKPAPTVEINSIIDDETIRTMTAAAGVDRVVDIAAALEAAQ